MKANQVEVGMLVSVNDLPDGQVYTVHSQKTKHLWYLTCKVGDKVYDSGVADCSQLRKPTKAQMKNYKKQIGVI